MDYTEKLAYQSNYWYNDGLRKAQIWDLSGAIASLRRSLQFNRENIMARNLLGLVYYGRGEVVEALVEWIISKNFKSYENIANYYIKKVQETPSELETINQAVHKFNQCLTYCQQNGEDLAVIQLKKVIAAHPTYLKAYQLLALLYLHTAQYAKARQILRTARKMDTTNVITLSYIHELSEIRSQKMARLKEEKDQTVTYNLGNETIIQPASSSLKDNAGVFTLVNIAIGILVGAAVIWFLIVPAVNQSKATKSNKSIVAMSEQITSQEAQINALKKELESYRSTSDEAESAKATAESTQESYEKLMMVYDQYKGDSTSNADMLDGILAVNPDSIGEQGRAIYDEIAGALFPKMNEKFYKEANASMEAANYAEAITTLEKIILMDAGYDEGKALKLLGDAYDGSGDSEKAKETYQKVVKNHPGTEAADTAQRALDGTPAEANQTGADADDGADE